jgi:DNA replication protein DnaC
MTDEPLAARARQLGFHGLLEHWQEVEAQPWLPNLLAWEEHSRADRGLVRRVRQARLGTFKPLDDFDWTWPTKIDRDHIEDLLRLDWLDQATNVVLVGPNGVGKTLLAKNLVHQAVLAGSTARFLTASELLNSLAEQESAAALRRKIAHFTRPKLLAIDLCGVPRYVELEPHRLQRKAFVAAGLHITMEMCSSQSASSHWSIEASDCQAAVMVPSKTGSAFAMAARFASRSTAA